jgi:hypothetical protein
MSLFEVLTLIVGFAAFIVALLTYIRGTHKDDKNGKRK